ncbi:polyhomeotic-like protein 3 isoform X1, partial [Lates japonicus]
MPWEQTANCNPSSDVLTRCRSPSPKLLFQPPLCPRRWFAPEGQIQLTDASSDTGQPGPQIMFPAYSLRADPRLASWQLSCPSGPAGGDSPAHPSRLQALSTTGQLQPIAS